jgi:CPA2 family monovalent cation:H+ antiporter-2
LLATIIIATAVWGATAAELLSTSTRLPDHLAWVVVIAAAALLALPFCIGLVRCAGAIARLLGGVALPSLQTGTDLADAPRRVLTVTLELAILLLIGLPLVALTQPFLPPFPGAAVMAVVMVLLAVALWRSATNLQEHARAGAQAIVEVLARQLQSESGGAAENPDLHELHRLLPGLGAPAPLRVQSGTAAEGKTLAQLNLRGLTGATVLAIVRERGDVLTPTGRETLQVGDLLAVAGTTTALEAARLLIGQPRDPADPPPLPAGDPMA